MLKPSVVVFFRKGLTGLALCAVAFASSGWGLKAAAQSAEEVQLTAQVGFDGYCKQDAWLPVHVTVENSGADLDATVQVSYTNSNNGVTSTSTAVALPATSRKQFFLYIYPHGILRNFQISVLDGKKALQVKKLSLTCLGVDNMIFGVLAANPSAFDGLSDVKPLSGFVRVAQLQISDLPERVQGWEALDALVISSVDTAALTPEQKQALEIWIGKGGKVLVTGGAQWQGAVAGLADLLPLDVQSTRPVASLAALQSFVGEPESFETGAVLSVGTVRSDADVLVAQEGLPVLLQRSLGFGAVYFFAADPTLAPLSTWEGLTEVYSYLLGPRPPLPRWTRPTVYDYSSNRALGAIKELGLPSIFYITCLLGFYVVVIGPLNYVVLRRTKRREFAWVTIPALAAIFACVAYGAGYLYRGTTPILNRLVLIQAWDHVPQAQAHAWVGIYSPVRTRYTLEAADGFIPMPFGSGADTSAQGNNSWSTVQADDQTLMPDIGVEIGGMRPVELEGSLPALALSHDLELTVSKSAPFLSGSVQNDSSYPLKNVIIITPGYWQRLGDLQPGESKSVQVSLALGANGPEFYRLDPMSILNLTYPDIQTKVEAARQQAFLESIFTTNYLMNDGNWGIYLMALLDEPVLPAGLQDKKFDTVDTTLYFHQLQPVVTIEPGRVNLPASLFVWETTADSASPYYTSSIPAGGYVLRFKPGFLIDRAAVRSLTLTLQTNTLPGGVVVSAWDYTRRTWVQVSRAAGIINIPEVERFVGPGGEVRIRFVGNQSGWFEIQDSYITMVMEP